MIGNIQLDVFQGPLDLLLTLIEQQEIDVNDIPVAEVTAQYLSFLHEVEELDLEWASEFIVLGAELLALKARIILQRPLENEDRSEDNPVQELSERLQTYRIYKNIVSKLEKLAAESAHIYSRQMDQEAVGQVLSRVNPLDGVTPDNLARALVTLIKNRENISSTKEEVIHNVNKPKYSLVRQMRRILRRLNREQVFALNSFFSSKPTRLEMAVTFLALLELAARGKLLLRQEKNFGVIKIVKANKFFKGRAGKKTSL